MASTSDILRTPEINVDRVAVRFNNLCCFKKLFRIIRAELHDQRSVTGSAFLSVRDVERFITVGFSRALGEHLTYDGQSIHAKMLHKTDLGMDHWGVNKLRKEGENAKDGKRISH